MSDRNPQFSPDEDSTDPFRVHGSPSNAYALRQEALIRADLTEFVVRAKVRYDQGERQTGTRPDSLDPREQRQHDGLMLERDEFIKGLTRVKDLYTRHVDGTEKAPGIDQAYFNRILGEILTKHLLTMDRFNEVFLLLDLEIIDGKTLHSPEIIEAAGHAIAKRISSGERVGTREMAARLAPNFFHPDNEEAAAAVQEHLRTLLRRGALLEASAAINMFNVSQTVLDRTREDVIRGIELQLPFVVPPGLINRYALSNFINPALTPIFDTMLRSFLIHCFNHPEDPALGLSGVIELSRNYTLTKTLIDETRALAVLAAKTMAKMAVCFHGIGGPDNDKEARRIKSELVQLADLYQSALVDQKTLKQLAGIATTPWVSLLARRDRLDGNDHY